MGGNVDAVKSSALFFVSYRFNWLNRYNGLTKREIGIYKDFLGQLMLEKISILSICQHYEIFSCIDVWGRVLNFDVYRSVRVVCTGPRGYRYADHPLLGGTSVLTSYRMIKGLYRAEMVEIWSLPRRTSYYALDFDRH